ncbi:MAG: type II toxin-antitoxin system antitoxin SocA domain-containing protein [Thermoplasmata archaeon]
MSEWISMAQVSAFEPAVEVRDAAARIALGHPHGLPQVRLLKLLWLAELRYYEETGKKLTGAGWWRWSHGPYSKDVINAVKRDTKTFRVERQRDEAWQTGLVIHANPRAVKQPLDLEGVRAIDEVLFTYKEYTNEELIQEVYTDPFFEATPFSHDFDFSKRTAFRRSVPRAEERRLLELPTRPVTDFGELFAP